MKILAVLGKGVVDPEAPVLHADDAGLTRGDGCFEGVRVLPDGTIDKPDAHFARLGRSAKALEIEYDEPAWRDLVAAAVDAWAGGEAAMKWMLTRGRPGGAPTGLVMIAPIDPDYPRQRADGIRAITLPRGTTHNAFEDAPWLLGGVKTLSYAVNMAAHREAERRGVEDVIFVSQDGHVLEAPTGTVVWTTGRELHTTPLGASGILAGTTQARLWENAAAAGWAIRTTDATVADLHAAETLLIASSVRGPVEVVRLDDSDRDRRVETVREIQRLAGF